MRLARTALAATIWGAFATAVFAQGPRSTKAARPTVPGAPAGVTAFVDVAVVPMDTERVLEHQTVLVEQGRITAIGSVDKVPVPAGATKIEGKGEYLIPGLADMHAHIMLSPMRGAVPTGVDDSAGVERRLFLWLAQGVTTIRNMDWQMTPTFADSLAVRDSLTAARVQLLLGARARAAAGVIAAPRVYTAGPWMRPADFALTPGGPTWYLKPKDVAARVAAYKQAGFDFVKPYHETNVLFDSLVAAAKRYGLPLAGHVPEGVEVEHAIPALTSIEHLTGYAHRKLADPAVVRALVEATRKAGTWNCVTLAMLEHFLGQGATVNSAPSDVPYPEFVKALQAGGARLLLGTDDPGGDAVYQELQALVDAGLTPYQALVASTRNPAEYFGTLRETGTIAVGKRADLVLLEGNPLQQIRSASHPDGVMIGGRWVPREEIDKRLNAINSGG